jgi:hypothetical protein
MSSQTLPARWGDARLEPLRTQGDPAADAAIAEIFARGEVAAVNQLIGQLFRNSAVPPEELPAPARVFFDATAALPAWADQARLARASAFFGRHAGRAMLILSHYSLPACYAARKGVQVLHLTTRLSRNPRPRLLETAQLVFDVMAPHGLGPQGAGVRSAQKVRLMHAAVRHLILQHGWSPEYDLPINQEDMLGTLMTFSWVILDGLRKLGFAVAEEDAAAYLHAWNVVGALMGVREEVLPADVEDAGRLMLAIQRRHFAPCPEGRQLTAALVQMLRESSAGGPFANMPVSMVRFFLGDATADLLGVPPADWTRELMAPLRLLGWATSETHGRVPLLARLTESYGATVVDGLLRMERSGHRAEFRIPEALRSAVEGGARR